MNPQGRQAFQASDFQVVRELHRSTGGAVYVSHNRRTGAQVVLKERLAPELGKNSSISHELELYEKLPKHPNVVAYHGSFWRGAEGAAGMAAGASGRGGRRPGSLLVMVFEYCSKGDLHTLIQSHRARKQHLSERQILQLVAQIAAGVQHLHAHGVIHRDIKSLNVVLDATAPGVGGPITSTLLNRTCWQP
eukprot:2546104-Pleurochrysis_carterae.AAC.1